MKLTLQLKKLNVSITSTTGVVNCHAAIVATNAKLPKLELMKYDGKILKSNEF